MTGVYLRGAPEFAFPEAYVLVLVMFAILQIHEQVYSIFKVSVQQIMPYVTTAA
jgi:hypothetical protein